MDKWKKENGFSSPMAGGPSGGLGGQYRDRAKERRQKYGLDEDAPKPNKLKEKYMRTNTATSASPASTEVKKVGSENIGNKMLQKMGWKEGLGLGKTNQGRTSIIEVRIFVDFFPIANVQMRIKHVACFGVQHIVCKIRVRI